jgi:hypothetical protein
MRCRIRSLETFVSILRRPCSAEASQVQLDREPGGPITIRHNESIPEASPKIRSVIKGGKTLVLSRLPQIASERHSRYIRL